MPPKPLDPLISEFETEEQEAAYTAWLQAEVEASLADPRPSIPHDEVERRMTLRLANIRRQYEAKPAS
ncbi:MAG: stability determinant [Lautropia sp.]|nr:stability determinant [Lautropia sp.]